MSVERQFSALHCEPAKLLRAKQWLDLKRRQLHESWLKLSDAPPEDLADISLYTGPLSKRCTFLTSLGSSSKVVVHVIDAWLNRLTEATEELFRLRKSFNDLQREFRRTSHSEAAVYAHVRQLAAWFGEVAYSCVHKLSSSFSNIDGNQKKQLFEWLNGIAYSYASAVHQRVHSMAKDYIRGFFPFAGATVYSTVGDWLETAVRGYILRCADHIEGVLRQYATWFVGFWKSYQDHMRRMIAWLEGEVFEYARSLCGSIWWNVDRTRRRELFQKLNDISHGYTSTLDQTFHSMVRDYIRGFYEFAGGTVFQIINEWVNTTVRDYIQRTATWIEGILYQYATQYIDSMPNDMAATTTAVK